jgi:hypothetical protein
MANFTIIKDDEIKRVISLPSDNIDSQLRDGETAIRGAYPEKYYKIVNGEPLMRSESETLEQIKKSKKHRINPNHNAIMLAKDLAVLGYSSQMSLPDTDQWTIDDAKYAIDLAAGKARFKLMSAGTLLNEEYQLTLNELNQWIDIGSPETDVPETLQSWVDASGMSLQEAAQNIEDMNNLFTSSLKTIRRIRLAGKAKLTPDSSDFHVLALATIQELENL